MGGEWVKGERPGAAPAAEPPQRTRSAQTVRRTVWAAPGAGMLQKPEKDRGRTAQLGGKPGKAPGGPKLRNIKTDPGVGSHRRGGHVGGRGSNLSALVVILQQGGAIGGHQLRE